MNSVWAERNKSLGCLQSAGQKSKAYRHGESDSVWLQDAIFCTIIKQVSFWGPDPRLHPWIVYSQYARDVDIEPGAASNWIRNPEISLEIFVSGPWVPSPNRNAPAPSKSLQSSSRPAFKLDTTRKFDWNNIMSIMSCRFWMKISTSWRNESCFWVFVLCSFLHSFWQNEAMVSNIRKASRKQYVTTCATTATTRSKSLSLWATDWKECGLEDYGGCCSCCAHLEAIKLSRWETQFSQEETNPSFAIWWANTLFSVKCFWSNSQIQTKGWFDVSGLSHSLAFTNSKLNLL